MLFSKLLQIFAVITQLQIKTFQRYKQFSQPRLYHTTHTVSNRYNFKGYTNKYKTQVLIKLQFTLQDELPTVRLYNEKFCSCLKILVN